LSEHLTQKQLEDYCLQRLPVAELLPVSQHVGECEVCRQEIESAVNADAAFFAVRSSLFADVLPTDSLAHLTAAQISSQVDNKLSGDELQFVTDHLRHCDECVLAVDDVRAFSKELAPSVARELSPSARPAATERVWQRTFARLTSLFRPSPVPALGVALALLLLAVIGWLFVRRLQEQRPKKEIAVVPAASPQVVPTALPFPSLATKVEPEIVAQLNDGKGVLSLDREGKLSGADELPAEYQSFVKKALTTRQVERAPQLEGLSRPPSSLMSANKEKGEFSLIEPAGNVLLSNRPTFRWSTLEGATEYTVEVYDSNFKLVAASPQLTSNLWASPPLPRGHVYAWQVKATKEGQEVTSPRPPAPQAKFRVLDQAKTDEIVRARRAYPSSHLIVGLLYADAGLLKEAEQELRLLQKANPDSEIARSLLRQVQALRRPRE
jgi:anti-sigma factor RsiW